MRKILFFVLVFLISFSQAQVNQKKKNTKQKEWVNPVKLTKEEHSRPYMIEVLKTRDSLSPTEAERRRKNIEAGNPFKKYGYYPKVATLSKGKYLEFHDQDSIVTIGSVKFNVKKGEITDFDVVNLDDPDAQPIGDTHGRWISPDPLSEEFSDWSPYNISFNNPIKFIDPDGRAPEDATQCCWWFRLMPLFENSSVRPSPVVETMTKTTEATAKTQEHFNRGRRVETEQISKMNEEGQNVTKNNQNYEATDPKTGKTGGTRPDAFTEEGRPVEVKNVRNQGLTRQLRYQDNLVEGKKLILRINNDANLTKPLKNSGIEIQPYNIAPPVKIDNVRVNRNPPPKINPVPVKKDPCDSCA